MYGISLRVQMNVRHCFLTCYCKRSDRKSAKEWPNPFGGYVAHCQREFLCIRFVCPTKSEPSNPTPLGQDIVSYFWSTLVILIPRSLEHGITSQQFFEITLLVFRSIDDSIRENLDFAAYIQVWSDLLLRHKHEEVCRKCFQINPC